MSVKYLNNFTDKLNSKINFCINNNNNNDKNNDKNNNDKNDKNKLYKNYKYLFHKYNLHINNPREKINYNIINNNLTHEFKVGKYYAHLHCYDISRFMEIYGDYIDTINRYFYTIITYSIGSINIENSNSYVILKIPNKGLDIGAKFCAVAYLNSNKIHYDYILFLHSKSNPETRKKYFKPIVGNLSREFIENINGNDSYFPDIEWEIVGDRLKWVSVNPDFLDHENTNPPERNLLYRDELLKYLVGDNNTNHFIEGNCYILSKRVIDKLYTDPLLYNILNTETSFDYNWVCKAYNTRGDIYQVYRQFLEGKLAPRFNNNLSRDAYIEHVFERVVLNFCSNYKCLKNKQEYPLNNQELIKTNLSKNNSLKNKEEYLLNNYKLIYQNCSNYKNNLNICSVCTMSTESNIIELKLFLLSLNEFNNDLNTYIICDNFINNYLNNHKHMYKNLNITSVNHLSCKKYDNISSDFQQDLEKKKIWIDFMLEKTTIMKYALERNMNTIFLDSDIVFLDKLPMVSEQDVYLSIHDTNYANHKQFGLFNGGCVYSSSIKFCDWWREKTYYLQNLDNNDSFMEQGTLTYINDTNFSYSVFDNGFNLGYWRPLLKSSDEEKEECIKNIYIDNFNNKLMYNDKVIKSVHTHFFQNCKFPHQKNIVIPFNRCILNTIELLKNKNVKIDKIYKFITNYQNKLLNSDTKNIYNEVIYNSGSKNIFICDNGLTNRLLTIFNALNLSNYTGKPSFICWNVNNTCRSTYYDIFTKHPELIILSEYEFKSILQNEKICHISTRELNEINYLKFINDNKKDYIFNKIDESIDIDNYHRLIEDNKNRTILFSTYYLFFNVYDKKKDILNYYNSLGIQNYILNKFYKIKDEKDINSSVYGIHLRYTDQTFVQNNLNIKSRIIDDIKNILLNESYSKFYIASDDNSVKQEFYNLFPNNIIYYDTTECKSLINFDNCKWGNKFEINNINRTKDACIDGFIEWLLLKETNFRFPTAISTYSILISLLQNTQQKWFVNGANVQKSIDYKLR